MYVNKTEICQFNNLTHNISWYNFCLETHQKSKTSSKDEQSEISLNGTIHDFSVDHSSIKEEEILNIHQYFVVKNIIKRCFILSKNIYQIIN